MIVVDCPGSGLKATPFFCRENRHRNEAMPGFHRQGMILGKAKGVGGARTPSGLFVAHLLTALKRDRTIPHRAGHGAPPNRGAGDW